MNIKKYKMIDMLPNITKKLKNYEKTEKKSYIESETFELELKKINH